MTAGRTSCSADITHVFRGMPVDVTVRLVGGRTNPRAAAEKAEAVFRSVEQACTRFDPASPLMRANAAADKWRRVPAVCFEALSEAAQAHTETGGRFDPRVLAELAALGYDRSLPFGDGPVELGRRAGSHQGRALRFRSAWCPEFDRSRSAVRIGPFPVDLGGIGKGLAVRWAADCLGRPADSFLIEGGGDLITMGPGPQGDGWHAAVEDPRGGDQPLAVLDVTDRACATSSIRLRTWRMNGRLVHHLLDPLTGQPGGAGLLSVTVLGTDPAWAEARRKSCSSRAASTSARQQ
jgi:thiamine biosynthesis lipoprotein